MNYKSIGEIGQNCAIGELSKYGIEIAILLSDNLPYDFIAIAGNKMFKIQVKTSTENKNGEYTHFSLQTNNWLQGTQKKYTKEDCDIVILYDLVAHKCFLLLPKNFEDRGNFTIRYKKNKAGSRYGINWYEDYIISNDRIKKVFDFDVPDMSLYFCEEKKKYKKACKECGKEFEGNYKNAKYCSSECKSKQNRKVERPSKKELEKMIKTKSFVKIGKEYGVSDNAVRKWTKAYNITID